MVMELVSFVVEAQSSRTRQKPTFNYRHRSGSPTTRHSILIRRWRGEVSSERILRSADLHEQNPLWINLEEVSSSTAHETKGQRIGSIFSASFLRKFARGENFDIYSAGRCRLLVKGAIRMPNICICRASSGIEVWDPASRAVLCAVYHIRFFLSQFHERGRLIIAQ